MNIDLKTTKAIIFDLDGTLADSMPLHYESWQKASSEFGLKFPSRERFYALAGTPSNKMVKLFIAEQKIDIDIAKISKRKTDFFLSMINKIKPINKTINIAKKYTGILPMAVGTGSVKKATEAILSNIGLGNFFDAIVTAEDVLNHKPEPDTFLKCAELLKVKAEQCLVFEDSKNGIKAAQKANMMYIDVKDI